MATASVPPPSTKPGPHPSDGLIAERIEAVRAALWRSELTRSVLILVLLLIGVLLGWAIIDQWIWSGGPVTRLVAWAGLLGLLLCWSARRILPLFRSQVDARYAAYSIERDIPEMKHALSSYVSLRDQRDAEGLRGVVVRSIGSRAAGRLKQHEGLLPSEVGSSFRLWMMVAAALAVLAAYTVFSPKDTIDSAGRLLLPLASIDAPTRVRISDVEPGDTEIVAGEQLDVTAMIRGLDDAEKAHVIWETGSTERHVAMQIDPERGEPYYHASLGGSHGVEESGHYTVAAGDGRSERFEIRTSDVPVVRVESVRYQPPAYTGQPERMTRAAAIEGLEGTTVTLHASTNRPVAEAQIDLNPRTSGGRTSATAGVFPMQIDEDGKRLTAEIVLRIGADQPGVVPLSSYRLRVADADGATNPDPVIYPIRILPDLAPEVTIATPVRHPKDVPVDAQQLIEVHALDPDFGLTRVALRMQHGARQLKDVDLWAAAEGNARNRVSLYRFRPQQLGLSSGDVITLRAVAEDNRRHPTDHSPAPNVTVSDPIELRIVDAARMSESRPSEDGLSAPDDQPAVEPPNQQNNQDQQQPQSGQQQGGESGSSGGGSESSGSGQQSEGSGQSGGEGSSGGSGSDSSEGSGSDSGGSAGSGQQGGESGQESQGSGQGAGGQAGDQQGTSSGKQGASGAEGSGSQPSPSEAGSPEDAGNGNAAQGDPAAGNASSEGSAGEASATDGATGQPPDGGTQQSGANGTGEAMETGERGDGTGSQPAGDQSGTSGTEANGEGAAGTEPAGDGATDAPSSADGASNADGAGQDATGSSEGGGSAAGNQGQQGRSQGSAQGQPDAGAAQSGSAGARDGSESSSPAPSPPAHDGEAFERIQEYLENQRQNRGDGSPAGEGAESGDPSENGSSSPGPQGNRDGSGDQRSNQTRESDAEGSPTGADSAAGEQSADSQSSETGDSPREGAQQDSADNGTSQGGDSRGMDSQDGGSQPDGPPGGSGSEQSGGDTASSDSGAEESPAGQDRSGQAASESGAAGESNEGTSETSESPGDRASSDGSAAPRDGTSGSSNDGEQPSNAVDQNREQNGSETNGASEPAGSQPPGGSSSGASPTSDPADGAPQGEPGAMPPSGSPPSGSDGSAPSGRTGSSASGAGSEEFIDSNETPEPVDLEYAREATDMVLDYLKETREQPDQELLDRLNWTEADMRRFLNRWEAARQMEQTAGGEGSEEFEEALRSLGLRDRSTAGRGEVDQADRLRDLRDSGTRRPAPTLYRDAFEAFRRSVGQ